MQVRLNAYLAADLTADSGLSYADYVVLVMLTDQPDGRARANQIGEVLGWEQSRVSHHIARMADRGLVTRERCDADRRGAYVVLTDAGRAAIVAAAPGHVSAVRRSVVDVLTPAELETLGKAAAKVVAALDALESE
jgi:DNA-binding MarR family transcriptional regulator